MDHLHIHYGQKKCAEVHMEQGPIGRTLLFYAFPIFLSQILQQMYSVADCMIIGQFAGGNGLAAAGEGSLILSVIINFFIGFSSGVSAVTAAAFGARDYSKLKKAIHVVILGSLLFGAVMTAAGILSASEVLRLIGCPENIFDLSRQYLIICMLGVIPQFLYNMGISILRSLGNTREPLYYLAGSTILNLVLDLLFVAGFHTGLAGAAAATVLSQWLLALILLWRLTRMEDDYRLTLAGLSPSYCKNELPEILQISLPAGMQAIFMSISSMVIQTSINAFGSDAAAGMVVFARIEGFLYYPAFSYGMALTGFIGQNFGAKKIDRVRAGMRISMLTLSLFMIVAGALLIFTSPVLLRLFTSDPEIIRNGSEAILCILPSYAFYAINQIYMGGMKGLGHTGYPMIACLVCYCIFRVVWCRVLLRFIWDIRVIYFSYGASLILMSILLTIWYRKIIRPLSAAAQQP